MTDNSGAKRDSTSIRRAGIAVLLAVGFLAIGLLGATTHRAIAAAPTVTQCNNETASNTGGQGVRCTVVVVNYLTSSGTLAATPASSVTLTKCTGAAGPIAAGAGTCATTTTTTTADPITAVQQCDGEGGGGGGVVICTATITNHFAGGPAIAPTAAAVYQCVGSVITGTGAPGTCTPANTTGITSVGAATVGQCNGSGNGGTSVGFTCTVAASSTVTTTLPVNIDQCNGSTNGGGALTTCQATVTNISDASVTPPVVATPVVAPTVVAPVVVPPVVAPVVVPPVVAPVVVAPTVAPVTPAPLVVPAPAKTGNAGIRNHGTSLTVMALLGLVAAGLVLGGRKLVSREHAR